MAAYHAPLRDMRFVLFELFGGVATLPGLDFVTPELAGAVLAEAARFSQEVLAPLNRSGDEEGARLENGAVRTPRGFQEAFDLYRRGGWTGIACDPEHGGQGLPAVMAALVEEMVFAANPGFDLYPGLIHGAYLTIRHHGDAALKARWLPPLVAGRHTATMGLTEPQAGSDLALTRARARPAGDGTYLVTGTKMFTSGGDHDLAENIVHLVLARLPDAPAGTRGISLFLVPKFLPGADGRPGARNRAAVGSIEHKMGLRASATCVMNYDEAVGWLVGAPHRGLPAMFTMMNDARLMVGVQGVAVAEAAYQGAAAYAAQRLQGRAPAGPAFPELPADPLTVHPDVRRMLLTMRVHAEGCRALVAWVGRALDVAARAADPARREAASRLVALMTPVVKALCTDLGGEAADLAIQVLGGHGYVRDHGIEQIARDGRVTRLYEGTNGIQALDLARRKLPAEGGRDIRRFQREVARQIAQARAVPALAPLLPPLAAALARLRRATRRMLAPAGPGEVEAAATEYLHLLGLVALGGLWLRMAAVAASAAAGDGFYAAKLLSARFFMEHILPRSAALAASIAAGGATLAAFDAAAFPRD